MPPWACQVLLSSTVPFVTSGNGAVLRGLDCCAKAGDACADYQIIGRLLVRSNGVNINEITSEVRLEH